MSPEPKADNLKTYGGPSDPKILVGPGDILVSLKDVTQAADLLGSVVTVPASIGQGRLTQDTVKLVFDDDFSERNYIYWLLRTPQARDHCRRHATGTTNLGLAREDFLAIEVPPLDEGRENLLQVLQALDDKIELNRRMNETLEAQARALFRDWFVDFGPVKAKMAGAPPYFAAELWSLFPDRLNDVGVPEGWRTYRVDELADQHTKSLKPMDAASEVFEHFSLPAYDSGQHPVLEVGGGIKSNKTIVPNGAILLSKLNPEIPRVWWPQSKGAHRQIASTEFLAFTAKSGISPALLYSLFSDQTFRQRLEGMVTGTSKSHQRVSPPALRSLEALAGDAQVFTAFGQIVTSLMQKVLANRAENHTLAQTRDLLLPKLMSGEIRVRESG